jgi:hypothetical protein
MKEKLFWPLVAVAIVAVAITAFLLVDTEDDDEIAAQFIPRYETSGSKIGPDQPNAGTEKKFPGNRHVAKGQNASRITVNGSPLTDRAIVALTGGQGTIPPGDYWYDQRSGLWGLIGGPTRGQIRPGLPIAGGLPPNASGGRTGIFFNGREIHPIEVRYIIQLLGTAIPGRYWLNPDLSGGPEGGPKLFSLAAAQGFNRNTAGGSILGDGRGCIGVMVPGRPGGPSTTVSSGC